MISIGFCTLSVIIRQQKQNLSAKKSSLVENSNRKYKKKNIQSFIFKIFSFERREAKREKKLRKNDAMKVEVHSAADFVMNLLRVRQKASSLSETQLHSFRGSLIIVLLEKYNNHWYENNPRKGKLPLYDPHPRKYIYISMT